MGVLSVFIIIIIISSSSSIFLLLFVCIIHFGFKIRRRIAIGK